MSINAVTGKTCDYCDGLGKILVYATHPICSSRSLKYPCEKCGGSGVLDL
jgi:DnaJ-class molecular chaperone